MKLKEFIDEDKPREKLISKGASFLSDSELLQILLRVGSKNESVNELSCNMLKEAGSLLELSNYSFNKLSNIKGIKESKATILLAAFELSKRINKKSGKFKLTSSEDIFEYFRYDFINVKQEMVYVVLFDTKLNFISKKVLFLGTVDGVDIHPREIFKYAISESASSFVLIHNHPSGDTTPSSFDIDVTDKISKASEVIGIKFLDHIVISSDNYYSFYEESLKKK